MKKFILTAILACCPALLQAQQGAAAGENIPANRTHVVTTGDTLWGLSGRYYNDPYKWGKIYNANLDTVSNPDRIYPSEELIIPDLGEGLNQEMRESFAGEVDTAKEAEFTASDIPYAREDGPAAPAAAAVRAEAPDQIKEELPAFEADDLSEELPEHQKEWGSAGAVVADGWRPDGIITGKEKGDDESMADSFSTRGSVVTVSMNKPDIVRQGDYLVSYLKGGAARDKAGKKIGREIQSTGLLEVLSVRGSVVKATVLDYTTAVTKDQLVKKR